MGIKTVVATMLGAVAVMFISWSIIRDVSQELTLYYHPPTGVKVVIMDRLYGHGDFEINADPVAKTQAGSVMADIMSDLSVKNFGELPLETLIIARYEADNSNIIALLGIDSRGISYLLRQKAGWTDFQKIDVIKLAYSGQYRDIIVKLGKDTTLTFLSCMFTLLGWILVTILLYS